MIAVAAGDEVAVDAIADTVLVVGDERRCAAEIVQCDIRGFIDSGEPRRLTLVHQIMRHLGLAIDGDMLATGQTGEVDAVQAPIEGERYAGMRQTLGVQPIRRACLAEQVDGALFEHARANTPEHMLAARPLENACLDTDGGKQLTEQQAGRPGPDDSDLCAH